MMSQSWRLRGLLALPLAVMLIGGAWRAAVLPADLYVDLAGYYSWAQAWVADGTLDPSLPLQAWDAAHFPSKQLNGRVRVPDKYPIGWSVAALPGVWVAQGLARAGNRWGGMHTRLDGASHWTLWWASMSVLCVVAIGYLCGFGALRRLTGDEAAAAGLLLAWLGTSAFAYTWWEVRMAHGVAAAFHGIALWAAVRKSSSPAVARWGLAWGAAVGMVIVTRVVDVMMLMPAVLLLIADAQSGSLQLPRSVTSRLAASLVAAGVGIAGPLLLQMGIWKAVYGAWWFRGYADEHFGWAPWNIVLTLISSNHGLLVWHPIVAIAMAGAVAVALRESGLMRILGASVLVTTAGMALLYGCWNPWWLGWSFGTRWAVDLLPLWGLGIAWALQRFPRHRRTVGALLVLFALTSAIFLTAQFAGKLRMEGRITEVPGTKGLVKFPWPW